MTDAMWDAIASTTPTVSREDDRRRAVCDDENDAGRGVWSPCSSMMTADGVSAALTMRDDAEREAGVASARNRGATEERPSARARCARREPKRTVLSDVKCVPVVRFGSVDVGETGREWLEIENDTASTQVRRGEPRTRRARRERERERCERFGRDDPRHEAVHTDVHDTRRIAR